VVCGTVSRGEPSPAEPVLIEDPELQLGPVVSSRITGMPTSGGGVAVDKLALASWWTTPGAVMLKRWHFGPVPPDDAWVTAAARLSGRGSDWNLSWLTRLPP
jgi:hypothetical protein